MHNAYACWDYDISGGAHGRCRVLSIFAEKMVVVGRGGGQCSAARPGMAWACRTSRGTIAQGGGVGAGEDDLGGGAGFPGFLPALGAEAPAVAGVEAGEAELGARGGEVVAAGAGEGEEVVGDADADGVAAAVGGAGVAAAVAEEAGHRVEGAGLQRLAEDVEAGVDLGLHGQYPVISR